MSSFDVIVIGSGAGFNVVSNALNEGLRVALVDKGPLGGTCLNNGCIPSKVLITPADIIRSFQDAKAIGVEGSVTKVDFPFILNRFKSLQEEEHKGMLEQIKSSKNLSYYPVVGELVGDYTLMAGDETITAPKIAIASGSRAAIPPIPGLKETGFIDNVTLLELKALPKSLAVIGAGYIGCEYGHFFSAMGVDVTLIGRPPVALDNEDPEVSAAVTKALSRYMGVMVGHEVTRVERSGDKKAVVARSMKDNKEVRIEAEEILVASGRRPNSDLLKPEKAGVAMDKKGYILVDEYLQTNRPGIFALGDAIGKYMFRHTANYEAEVVSSNMFKGGKWVADYHAVPHAVFTHPQVAHVGMTEAEALAAGKSIFVGRARYMDTAKGYALDAQDGFVKVITQPVTGRILGCSVVGEFAPEIVQQVVWMMNTTGQDYSPVVRGQIIHPAISEVLGRAFANLEHPQHHEHSS
jgi:dihydrolipoamide dehydrogenase